MIFKISKLQSYDVHRDAFSCLGLKLFVQWAYGSTTFQKSLPWVSEWFGCDEKWKCTWKNTILGGYEGLKHRGREHRKSRGIDLRSFNLLTKQCPTVVWLSITLQSCPRPFYLLPIPRNCRKAHKRVSPAYHPRTNNRNTDWTESSGGLSNYWIMGRGGDRRMGFEQKLRLREWAPSLTAQLPSTGSHRNI